MRYWLVRLRRIPQLGDWLIPTLVLKGVATALSVVLLSGDSRYFLVWAQRMTDQLWQQPTAWLHMLTQDEFHFGTWHLVFHGFSNTFFIMKVISVLNLASGGNVWLNSCYLSLFSFWGSWELVRMLRHLWSTTVARGAVGGFLLWPTIVYWTSGLTKESLLVGSGALVVASVLQLCYGKTSSTPRLLLVLAVVALLHFKMRFFSAAALLGVLSGLCLIRTMQQLGGARHRLTQVVLLVSLLAGGAWAASEVSPAFRLNKFTSQLQRNYSELLRSSRNRPHLEYPTLAPTTESVLQNAPRAVANVLTYPRPWEGGGFLYVIAGLENILLLVLLLVAVASLTERQRGLLPFAVVLSLLVYCVLLAALLGLTTPNLGTLSRYRVSFLPYLLLVVLQNSYVARLQRRLEPGNV
ncbi:hypothetical protein HMJ29_16410 [Hymenobacter taeanensis]|uniref:Glycosyltransferase RgtA/B/C/D-like domain-containing protein n=1 Tax=Hymenobacter taeanensis TaxID=2735321 RepID=A0A6M6BK03_9BACT|nr:MULTISPECIES: hypothetical protein [Hymenobacter]QJX48417.1 hypothetical protein HMJ29_16410 [Hymenobacter taeanensis]UOQ82089.1 hypothetical protein MUN83_04730 [Hymenobacter sp. 5414T-23]